MTLSNRLTLYIWVRQLQNFQNLGFKWQARRYVMVSIHKVLKELEIKYYLPTQKLRWDTPDGAPLPPADHGLRPPRTTDFDPPHTAEPFVPPGRPSGASNPFVY